jgi:hypothetical protein
MTRRELMIKEGKRLWLAYASHSSNELREQLIEHYQLQKK